jgi:hypothetical protein
VNASFMHIPHTRFRLWPNFEKRSVWTNENAEIPKVHPLSFHTRGRSPKDVAKSSASRAKFGSNKMLDPNFCRKAELFFSHSNIQNLTMDYFNILFQPKGFSSRHSLVQKSDASPLDLGIV